MSVMMIKETSLSGLTEALKIYMQEAVGVLAEEYCFSKEEGLEKLGELRVAKKSRAVKSKRVVPKIILPFCGVVEEDWCKAVRCNRGLFTQCTNACKSGSKYCTTCLKNVSVDNIPQYGLIEERGNEGWTDPNGKVPVKYGNIMSKIGVTKEEAITEAEKLGWTIPEDQFEVVKARKGRPAKKAKEADEKPKKRGRPKKSKPVVEGAGTGDDLIAQLVEQAQQQNEVVAAEETEDEGSVDGSDEASLPADEVVAEVPSLPADEVVAEVPSLPADEVVAEVPSLPADDVVAKKKVSRKTAEEKQAEKEAKAKLAAEKKAAKEAEKLAKAEAKAKLAAEKKAAKEAEKLANALAKKLAKDKAEKLAKDKAEKLAEQQELEPVQEMTEIEEQGELTTEDPVEEEEQEDDAVEVIKFTHEGVDYLRDADGTVYDIESQEEVGEWDDESKTLTLN